MYRENALPAPEVVRTFDVSTKRGGGMVVFLGVIAIFALVAGGVTMFAGAPPGIEPWMWPMIGVGVAALVGAFVRHRYRRRKLVVTRIGDRHLLAIADESVELEFPLRMSGSQFTEKLNRVPLYHVFLKLSDARGHGLLLHETRGAIYGAQESWFKEVDDKTPSVTFETGKAHMIAEIRDLVAELSPCL
jgi:hypothetical protein